MAEGKICVCPQCGKKFKLKAGFSAASFACSACGATVWLEGKPSATGGKRAPTGKGPKAGRGRRKSKTAAGKARRPAPAARGRRRQEEPEAEEEGRRPRYQKQSSNNTVIIVVGLVAVVAIGGGFFLMSGDKDETNETAKQPIPMEDGTKPAGNAGVMIDPTGMTGTTVAPTATGDPLAKPTTDDLPRTTDDPIPEEKPAETTKKPTRLDGTKSRKPGQKGASRWDPPATLGHLESTPPEMRKQIDEMIALMMDPQAGKDSLDSKAKLSAIGKPAFLPVLGAMAKVRDTITDQDSLDERLIESSLKLADACLREMDGYLNAKEKGVLRPGTDKKYISYILRLHYKRWQQVLKDMDEMPGPYDPASQYD